MQDDPRHAGGGEVDAPEAESAFAGLRDVWSAPRSAEREYVACREWYGLDSSSIQIEADRYEFGREVAAVEVLASTA